MSLTNISYDSLFYFRSRFAFHVPFFLSLLSMGLLYIWFFSLYIVNLNVRTIKISVKKNNDVFQYFGANTVIYWVQWQNFSTKMIKATSSTRFNSQNNFSKNFCFLWLMTHETIGISMTCEWNLYMVKLREGWEFLISYEKWHINILVDVDGMRISRPISWDRKLSFQAKLCHV
jgi:hypothetical protein